MNITRETIEKILREELAAVAEGTPDMSWRDEKPDPVDLISLTPPAAASKPAADEEEESGDWRDQKPWQDPRLLPKQEGASDWLDKLEVSGDDEAPVEPEAAASPLPEDPDPSDGSDEAELMELLNLLEGHMGQEAPPVENDQRARELLDGFKNMLKPQERAEPSACATFLRQLADMAEREGGAPDAGTMPKPLPNN